MTYNQWESLAGCLKILRIVMAQLGWDPKNIKIQDFLAVNGYSFCSKRKLRDRIKRKF